MSTNYYIYTEAKIGDRWIGIDPHLPEIIDKRENYKHPHLYDGSYELKQHYTYWNGSRSYFGNAYDKLREIGSGIQYAELSDEVKARWKDAVERETNPETSENSWFIYPTPVCVDYNTLKDSVDPKAYDYHSLVHKDQLFMYENGDIEDLYGVDHEDFVDLTPEEKQCYVYHEWDDSMGWNRYFKILLERVQERVYDFEDINDLNWGDSHIQYRIIVIMS